MAISFHTHKKLCLNDAHYCFQLMVQFDGILTDFQVLKSILPLKLTIIRTIFNGKFLNGGY